MTGARFFRRDRGVSQSAQVGGLVVAALALSSSLVAFGPRVGGAVADLFVCELGGSGSCVQQDADGTPTGPVRRKLAEEARPGSGVDHPEPVGAGGADTGSVPGRGQVEFSSCWQFHLDEPIQEALHRQHRGSLCRTADGASYTCDEQRTYRSFFGWTDWLGRGCRATDGSAVPQGLAACGQDDTGATHCDAQQLQSVLPAGRDPDHFEVYADPSSQDVGLGGWEVPTAVLNTYADVLAHCSGDAAAGCNATVTDSLRDISRRFNDLHEFLERCKRELGEPPVAQLHIVGSGEDAHAFVKVGGGWVDTADLPTDPAARAAIVHVLQYAASEQAKKAADTRSPGPIAAMIAYSRAMTGALDDLESGAGGLEAAGCGDIAQALSDLAAAPGPGEIAGYADDCVAADAAGACTDWRAQPLVDEGIVDGTTTADAGQGVTLSLTEQERDTGQPGLVPGRPDAGYDETVGWCQQNLATCRTEAQERAGDTARAAVSALRGIGVCTTEASCRAVAEKFMTGTVDSSCPQRWVGRYSTTLGSSGIIACGIIGGSALGYGITQWSGSAVLGSVLGALFTALLVTKGNVFAACSAPALVTAAQFDVEAQQNLAARDQLVQLRRLIREIPGWAAATSTVASQDRAAELVGDFFGRLEERPHNT